MAVEGVSALWLLAQPPDRLSRLLPLLGLAQLGLWVLLMVKAHQGEMFKLPVIGDIAEKQI